MWPNISRGIDSNSPINVKVKYIDYLVFSSFNVRVLKHEKRGCRSILNLDISIRRGLHHRDQARHLVN